MGCSCHPSIAAGLAWQQPGTDRRARWTRATHLLLIALQDSGSGWISSHRPHLMEALRAGLVVLLVSLGALAAAEPSAARSADVGRARREVAYVYYEFLLDHPETEIDARAAAQILLEADRTD